MPNLYELNHDYEKLLERLYDDELDEQAIIDTLDSIESVIEDKADGYSRIIKQLESDAAGLKLEETRMAARRRAIENRIGLLKNNLFNAMKTVGIPKIKTDLFTVSIQKNGGKRSMILDCGVDKLPPEMQKVTIEANSEALREYLAVSGEDACEYAHLAPQGESLRIR